MEHLDVPQGSFELARHPVRTNETLRAWDAADELVLRHVASLTSAADASILVVNDAWGTLAVALAPVRPWSLGDSALSHAGACVNAARNAVDPASLRQLGSLDPLPERVDIAIVKIPKTTALLEDQLRRIRPSLHADSVVVGAAMAKHLHSSTLALFEREIGPTSTSLAEKKARLAFASLGPTAETAIAPPTSFTVAPSGHTVVSYPGVFAAGRLDVGTRFFLEALTARAGTERVVDLGCGNGVLGMLVGVHNPEAEVVFVDESYFALASAKATWCENLGDRPATFIVADGAGGIGVNDVDRVICNPPFHENQAIGDATAWSMFADSREALRIGGELWVVGNRHLAYHAKLKRLFGNCDVVNASSKFVVLRATRATRAPAGPQTQPTSRAN